jgi:hypothetical protein
MTQEVGSQTRKAQMQLTTEHEDTMNQQNYCEVLTRLHESVRRKISELLVDKWIFHHENARAHSALSFLELGHYRDFMHVLLSPKNLKRAHSI